MTDQCPFCRGYCGVVSGCQLEAAQKDVADLNRLLRDVGWGQGEIDTAAVIAEENEKLRAALRKLVDAAKSREFDERYGSSNHCSDCGYEVHTPESCDYAAAIAEAERLLGDAT